VEFEQAFSAQTVEDLVDLGRYDEAMASAEEILPRLEAAGDVVQQLLIRTTQVRVRVCRGEAAAVAPVADWAVDRARELGDPQFVATVLPPAAVLKMALGDDSGAIALLTEVERSPRIRESPYYAVMLPDAMRTALAAEDPELAVRLAGGVEPVYPLYEHAATTAGAVLAEHRGEYGNAAAMFARAEAGWRAFEMPWEEGQALLGRGRSLLALGRDEEATRGLRRATYLFHALGATQAATQAEVALARPQSPRDVDQAT
jgi:tetratricopeptide (TPR) repeat protein